MDFVNYFVSLVLLFSKYLRESPLLKKLNFFNSSFDEVRKYSLEHKYY